MGAVGAGGRPKHHRVRFCLIQVKFGCRFPLLVMPVPMCVCSQLKELLSLKVLRGEALDRANRRIRDLEVLFISVVCFKFESSPSSTARCSLSQAQLLRKDELLLEKERFINQVTGSRSAEVSGLQHEVQRLNQVVTWELAALVTLSTCVFCSPWCRRY